MPTTTGSMIAIWNSRQWRNEAEAWIRESIAATGHELTGPIEQVRVRMWSTQLTVQSSARTWTPGAAWSPSSPTCSIGSATIGTLSRPPG